MPSLLSGSTLRRGGSGEFIDLAGAMPQLPATSTTETGFTLVTNEVLQTSYRSSLGFVEFNDARLWAKKDDGTIRILATGTSYRSTSTTTGNLVVQGGVGIGANMWVEEDIVVNNLTIGRGYEGYNNIVISGQAEVPPNDFSNGQESIVIGYDALQGLNTSNKSIAIGRYALNSGTELRSSIAIGDSALKAAGSVHYLLAGTITNISQTNPVVVTAPGHSLTSGTQVLVYEVNGMPEIVGTYYWVSYVTSSTVELYTDNILSSPLDGTGFTGYISSGTINRVYKRNNNIAIGVEAGQSLVDGEENFFFGGQIAKNLTTGSYNVFIGNDVGNNLLNVNGSISIGGDNLQDGVDNQINIGSVFYYNGTGTLTLNADTEIGLGTESTSSTTGALTVVGGAGILRDLWVGRELFVTSSSYFLGDAIAYGDILPGNPSSNLGSSTQPFNSLYLKGSTLYLSTVTLKSPDDLSFRVESPAGYVRQTVGSLTLNSNVQSNAFNNGALIVTGGAGISGDLNVNGQFNVLGTENVDISPAATVYIQPTISGSIVIRPAAEGYIDNMVIGSNDAADATFLKATVSSTASSTSTTTGALVVNGGVGIQGNIYTPAGNPDENYLLYTPRTTVKAAPPPTNPRIGDFWVDTAGPYFLQYVKSGTSTVWVQIT